MGRILHLGKSRRNPNPEPDPVRELLQEFENSRVKLYGEAVLESLSEVPESDIEDRLETVEPLETVDLGKIEILTNSPPLASLEEISLGDRLRQSQITQPDEELVREVEEIEQVFEENAVVIAKEVA